MNNMMTLAALAAALAGGAPAAAVELVTNGGFEADVAGGTQQSWSFGNSPYTGVTGWVINGADTPADATLTWYYPDLTAAQTNSITAQIYGPLNGYNNGLTGSANGGGFMALDGDSSFPGSLVQTISGLTPGKAYVVKFEWAGAQQAGFSGPTWDKYLTVSLGAQSQDVSARLAGPEGSFQPWRSERFTFTAANATETLQFLAHGMPTGMPPFVLLDGISMQAAVPEPASWATLIAGFGLTGASVRRRVARLAA